jgi:muramidase (phage lysozyme)
MNIDDLRQFAKNQNVNAFLRAIRLGEGTSDAAGYYRIVGGGHFLDSSRHPNQRIYIARYGVYSTAAGAYQIISPTWYGLVKQYGFPAFTPEYQDLGAIGLIAECGAIDDVISGDLQEAISKCAPIWASLPGSKAGQRTEKYADVENEFIKNGGVLA